MLMRLLSLVAQGSVQVYATLADQLGVSTSMLAQMLQDLARMEYIVPVGGACDTTSQCHHCPLGGSCTTDKQGNVWMLTAKGTQAARKK